MEGKKEKGRKKRKKSQRKEENARRKENKKESWLSLLEISLFCSKNVSREIKSLTTIKYDQTDSDEFSLC